MISWNLVAALVLAIIVHPFVLRIATGLMLEVQVPVPKAFRIVIVEYVAAGVTLALLMALNVTGQTVALGVAAIVLVAVGAILIGKWLSFPNGGRLGIGNGVLIQFMQVPLTVPFLILVSFLFPASR
ncbi:MAG: hypothetical protein ACT4NU_01995 [Chromatiales bacterium]